MLIMRSKSHLALRPVASHMFGFGRHGVSRDIMKLFCYLVSQDHVVRGSCDFMGDSASCPS